MHCRSLNKTAAPSLRIPARAIKETINSFSPRPSKRARRLLGECKKEPRRGQKNVDVTKNVVVSKIFKRHSKKMCISQMVFHCLNEFAEAPLQSNFAPFDCERHDDVLSRVDSSILQNVETVRFPCRRRNNDQRSTNRPADSSRP